MSSPSSHPSPLAKRLHLFYYPDMSERVTISTAIIGKRLTVEVDRQKLAENIRLYNRACKERPGELTTLYTDTPLSADERAVLDTIYREYVYPEILKKQQGLSVKKK